MSWRPRASVLAVGTTYTGAKTAPGIKTLPTPPSPGPYFFDSFTDVNSTPIASHTADSGQSWEILSGSGAFIYDPGRLSSNIGSVVGPIDTFDSAVNGVFDNIIFVQTGSRFVYNYFRWLDANNHYYASISGNGDFAIQRRVGGSLTPIGFGSTGVPVDAGGETLKVVIVDDQFTLIRQEGLPGEIVMGPYTDPSPFYGGTRIGFSTFASPISLASFDEVSYEPSA